jgi:hypothetical protein
VVESPRLLPAAPENVGFGAVKVARAAGVTSVTTGAVRSRVPAMTGLAAIPETAVTSIPTDNVVVAQNRLVAEAMARMYTLSARNSGLWTSFRPEGSRPPANEK